MQEVVDLYKRLAVVARDEGDRLASKHGLPASEQPIGVLGQTFNTAVMGLEVLDHYTTMWNRSAGGLTANQVAALKAQNGERIMKLNNSTFVSVMSACEFGAKQALRAGLKPNMKVRKRVYLAEIMEASQVAGQITQADLYGWDDARELRNVIIHNNAIPDVTTTLRVGPNSLTMVEDQMMQGNLKLIVEATIWVAQAFGRWVDSSLS
ncbi:MAG: hypothetical protein JJ896_02695 [Rhodothermales bacterium]|nr:hypothetical protein [Rhodothermales bacterium]MBO6778539.1 hypothetical protein [Rhodothermales bacterium]